MNNYYPNLTNRDNTDLQTFYKSQGVSPDIDLFGRGYRDSHEIG